jgi:hypothetical protein
MEGSLASVERLTREPKSGVEIQLLLVPVNVTYPEVLGVQRVQLALA